jgi:hypothetical protein
MTTFFAAVDIKSGSAVYGIGATEEDAVADARRQSHDPESCYDVIPCTEAAHRLVEDEGGAPGTVYVTPAKVMTLKEHDKDLNEPE